MWPMKAAFLFLSLCLPALADFAAGQQAWKDGDYAAALEEFLPLAQQGNASAQTYLGLMYDLGQGVAPDYKEAIKWFRLAAAHEEVAAQFNLGLMYEKGQGVPQDY